MLATDDGPCNVGAFLAAVKKDDDVYIVGQIVESGEETPPGDIENINDFIPEAWGGKFTVHLYPIEQMLDDMRAHPDQFGVPGDAATKYAEEGITHLALLEGPPEDDVGYFWCDGKKITGLALLVAYCAERQCYRMMHCSGCATTYQQMIGFMQPEWGDAERRGVQGGARPVN